MGTGIQNELVGAWDSAKGLVQGAWELTGGTILKEMAGKPTIYDAVENGLYNFASSSEARQNAWNGIASYATETFTDSDKFSQRVGGNGLFFVASMGLGEVVQGLRGVGIVSTEEIPTIVYRALTQADADAVAAGRGLTAKAPDGTWTAAEHVANAGPGTGGAKLNSPWISTTSRLDMAQAYEGGNGIIAIDLNKLLSLQIQVWQTAPRVNGVQGLPFQRSFWAGETTVYQQIPFTAILGPAK